MKNEHLRVGITHGDINGISYEVILNTLMDNRITESCTTILYGSAKVAAYYRKVFNMPNIALQQIKTPNEAIARRINLISIEDENLRVELGKSTQMAGESALAALELAVQHLKEGSLDVLVTGPINKDNIQSEKFHFKGHTEYLQSHFGKGEVLMMMVSEDIRVGVVTTHLPLNEVAPQITTDSVLSKIEVFNRSLVEDFALSRPRIAVLGLNPHAGDNGLLGKEEMEQIIPAIEKARNKGIVALGPYPADGFFGSGAFKKFDGILAMYHDQGMIPFKTLCGENGVNYTAGMNIIRTSPAHGTAYDIAGKGEANENSFRQAFYLAADIYKRREQYKNLVSNQLKSMDLSEFKNAEDQSIKNL
jgi:4-hydroxythreonine-4-phosphate dehydrogenase